MRGAWRAVPILQYRCVCLHAYRPLDLPPCEAERSGRSGVAEGDPSPLAPVTARSPRVAHATRHRLNDVASPPFGAGAHLRSSNHRMEQAQLVALAQGLAEQLRQEQQRSKEAEQRAKEAELRASAAKRAEVKAKSELGKQRAGWKQRKKKWLAYKVKHEALKVKYSRMQSIVHKELKARAKGPVSSPPVSAAEADGHPVPRDKNGGSTPPSQPPLRQPKKAPLTRKPDAAKVPAAALSALKAADSLQPSFPQPPEAAEAAAETERLPSEEAGIAESEAFVQKKAKAEASRKAAAEEPERTAEKVAAAEKAVESAIRPPPIIATSDTVPRSLGRGERRTRASPQSSSSVVNPKHPQVFHEVVRNKAARAKMDAVTSPHVENKPGDVWPAPQPAGPQGSALIERLAVTRAMKLHMQPRA